MVTKMATTFFEFQFDIAIPRGAPQHSAASNGGGNVGQSRGGSFAKKIKSLRLSGFTQVWAENLSHDS